MKTALTALTTLMVLIFGQIASANCSDVPLAVCGEYSIGMSLCRGETSFLAQNSRTFLIMTDISKKSDLGITLMGKDELGTHLSVRSSTIDGRTVYVAYKKPKGQKIQTISCRIAQ